MEFEKTQLPSSESATSKTLFMKVYFKELFLGQIFKKLLSNSDSTSLNTSMCQVSLKQSTLKFRTTYAPKRCLGEGIKKNSCQIQNQNLSISL